MPRAKLLNSPKRVIEKRIKDIETWFKSRGYEIDDEDNWARYKQSDCNGTIDPSDTSDEYYVTTLIHSESEDDIIQMSFTVTTLAHCCGVHELGDVEFIGTDNEKKSTLTGFFVEWVILNVIMQVCMPLNRDKTDGLIKGTNSFKCNQLVYWSNHSGDSGLISLLFIRHFPNIMKYINQVSFTSSNTGNSLGMYCSQVDRMPTERDFILLPTTTPLKKKLPMSGTLRPLDMMSCPDDDFM